MSGWRNGILICGLVAGSAFGQAGVVQSLQDALGTKPTAAAVEANPAMWKIKGPHETVYLFGSVHVMRPEVQWETAKVKAALAQSGTLYLEVADTGEAAQEAVKPLVMSLGVDAAHPLSTKISREDVASLDTALKGLGLPGEAAFEPMQPWLVYITLPVLEMGHDGYDPTSGIDRVLQQEAEGAGKPVKGFETAEAQIHLLADAPMPEQVAMLHETLEELPKSKGKMDQMITDWEHGDVAKIAAMEDADIRVKHPALYARLVVNRNEKIAETIAGVLKEPGNGTVFVAVGAAHLAGPDSILKMLEKKGFVAVREE